MTKKDYVLIAHCIKAERENTKNNLEANLWIDRVSYSIAEGLKEDNPHFDFSRFLLACGVLHLDA